MAMLPAGAGRAEQVRRPARARPRRRPRRTRRRRSSGCSGRTVMPGVFMSTSSRLMPLCFGASGSVRQSRKHQSAMSAWLVHTFWPLTTYSSPWRSPRRAQRRRGRTRRRARRSPDTSSSLAGHHRAAGSAARCASRAVLQHRRADQVDVGLRRAGGARRPGRAPARRTSARSRSRRGRRARAATRWRPSRRRRACAATRARSRIHIGSSTRVQQWSRRHAAGQVALEPGARLVGEGQLGGGEREVHARRNLAERPVD